MVAGCISRAAAAFSARANLSRALASSTGASSGAPDCSARCTDDFATAIFSFGIGVLAQATAMAATVVQAVVRLMNRANSDNISSPLFDHVADNAAKRDV